MPTGTQRATTSPGAERGGRGAFGFFAGGVLLEEAAGVEGFGGGAPDGGVGMDDGGRHLQDGACFEEICVVEDGVVEDEARGGAEGMQAEDLVEGGVEERAVLFHGGDVQVACWLRRRCFAEVGGDARLKLVSEGVE